MNCVICKTGVEYSDDTGSIVGGITLNDFAGYGSKFDGSEITVHICDNCLMNKSESGEIQLDEN